MKWAEQVSERSELNANAPTSLPAPTAVSFSSPSHARLIIPCTLNVRWILVQISKAQWMVNREVEWQCRESERDMRSHLVLTASQLLTWVPGTVQWERSWEISGLPYSRWFIRYPLAYGSFRLRSSVTSPFTPQSHSFSSL